MKYEEHLTGAEYRKLPFGLQKLTYHQPNDRR